MLESHDYPVYSIIDVKRAYIAGLFNGEGCVTVNPTNQLFITITNTNRDVLQFVANALNAGYIDKKPVQKNQSPCYFWRCHSRHAAKVLEKLLPYLIIKKQHALLAVGVVWLPVEQRAEVRSKIQALDKPKVREEN